MQPTLKQTLDLALQQHQSGRFSEAEINYRKVLASMPNHADALHLLGLVYHQSGREDLALQFIQKAVAINPKTAEYHNSLTAVYMGLDQTRQAIAAGRRAVQLQPQLPEASFNLGNALAANKQYEPAIEAYRRAIMLRPNYAQAYMGLGNSLNELKQYTQAIDAYRQAISHRPTLPDAHYNLGNSFRAIENNEQAVACYRQAIANKPDHLEAINNLACTLQQMGCLDEALGTLQQARAAHPHKARVHSNLGNVLAEADRWEEAIACYDQALAVQADFHEASFNRSLAHLMLGNFARGWPEYETRWLCRSFPSPLRYQQIPHWKGEPLNGRRILIHAEQGFGDTLQFARYVPMVAARGGKVIFQVQTALHRLLKNIPGAEVIAHDPDVSQIDFQCPLWSLPLAFETTLETIPAVTPGLFFDSMQSQQWRERLDAIPEPGHRMNVGLIWSGSPNFPHNYRRSTKLSRLGPLGELNGIHFISLQKGPAASQASAPPPGMRLIDWTNELDDFADTAALMNQLDLIITTDTGAAHLAALMGKPTWILLMYAPDFRWLRHREDSPWYPSVRLFRQPTPGDWESPIRQIVEQLKKT